jgi:hypothetical protein
MLRAREKVPLQNDESLIVALLDCESTNPSKKVAGPATLITVRTNSEFSGTLPTESIWYVALVHPFGLMDRGMLRSLIEDQIGH